MQPIKIYPEYALIITYDIKPGVYEHYFRWVSNELFPSLQSRKLYVQHLWHVVGGAEPKPERQIEFITEELTTIRRLLDSTEWQTLEARLQQYTENLSYRVVKYTTSFKI
ncbi:MAG: hypothetical protein ACFE0Q_01255 [Anaerolineae bacterium]